MPGIVVRRRPGRVSVVVASVLCVTAAGVVGWRATRAPPVSAVSPPAATSAAESAIAAEHHARDQDFALYTDAMRIDAASATFRNHLASLYLQRSRETGDFEDVRRAEALSRESLALRTQHNGPAFVTLAASLMSQHRFAEAQRVARQLDAGDPGIPAYRTLLAEIDLELGEYDSTRAIMDTVSLSRDALSGSARLARWLELDGRTEAADRVLRVARDEARQRSDLPREQVAWFYLRLGDLELRTGRLAPAEKSFRAGLAMAPHDHRLLAAMARLASAREQWRDVVAYGEASITSVLDPATLGLVAEAYRALGDTVQQATYEKAMRVSVGTQPGGWHRAWALYLLDHGQDVPLILDRARADVRVRRDIYGYDLAAWAAYKAGLFDEARQTMAGALRLGTRDATLFYHAGMIARSAGDDTGAGEYLRSALEVNPYLPIADRRAAGATLDTIAVARRVARWRGVERRLQVAVGLAR